jgi:hypothetical protein
MSAMTKQRWMVCWLICLLVVGAAAQAGVDSGSGIAFTRVFEPRESAFSILMPRGWQHQGGIYRVNAAQAGGPLNAIEAKCDWLFTSDARGTVAFRILPDIVYAHAGIGGGFFQPGSYYQGAEVRPLADASTHLKSLIQSLHPGAVGMRIIDIHRLPGEIESLNHGLAYTNQLLTQIGLAGQTFQCDAAGAVYDYTEDGTAYREVMATGVVDMRAAMTWKNTRTLAFRAPAAQFDRFRPIMDVMRFSIQFNPQWVLKEAQGQQERARIVLKVFDEIRRIDQEIVSRTTVNREEIMNDNFLVLTGQEEFINPHTGQVEVDTDAYRYRWKTPGGDVYYTNQEDENPNTFLHESGYERTQIRKRRNE